MALEGTFLEPITSLTIENAYFRISQISGGKEGFTVVVQCWANEEVRNQWDPDELPGVRKEPLCERYYQFIAEKDSSGKLVDGDNFIKQAYNHLKTLPDYEDCIDK